MSAKQTGTSSNASRRRSAKNFALWRPEIERLCAGSFTRWRIGRHADSMRGQNSNHGLVLIDYKTNTAVDHHSVSAYERQLQVYGRLLGDGTGQRVTGLFLVF